MSTILLIILILLLVGAVPAWPHSRGWGYYPSGILGILLIVLIVGLGSYFTLRSRFVQFRHFGHMFSVFKESIRGSAGQLSSFAPTDPKGTRYAIHASAPRQLFMTVAAEF